MVKKFTTSAQKTLPLSKTFILKKLKDEMAKATGLNFVQTQRENILEAKLDDGSKLVIASFDKGNGKALAMIDHKDLSNDKVRREIQKDLKQKLDVFFK